MAVNQAPPPTVERPSIVMASLIVLGVCVAVAAYLALNMALGLKEFYAGFFFLFFWLGVQKADLSVLPSTIAGAFFGLALALALHELPARMGAAPGMGVFLALVVVTIFLLIRQQLRFVVNDAAMLFLTLGTIVHIQAHADFRALFENLALTVAIAGATVWLLARLRSSAASRSAAATAART
jgi:hypothetical protein